MLFVSLLSILAVAESSLAANSHLICKNVDDVFSEPDAIENNRPRLQGPPGRMGPKGAQGIAGPVGPVGPAGEVDYDHIQAYIDDKEAKLAMKIEETNNTNQRLKSIIKGLCPVYIHDKCFIIVMGSYTRDEGLSKCQEFGGNLTNVYSEEHLNAIFDYVRSEKMQSSTYLDFHTGMTIEPSTGSVFLRDGMPAIYLKWYSSYPSMNPSSFDILVIRIRKDTTSTNPYFYNWDPTIKRNIICEI